MKVLRLANKAMFYSCLVICYVLGTMGRTVAGPPFLTDDPVPTDYRSLEVYEFASTDKGARLPTETQGPALEVNWGALRNVQVSVTVPYTFLSVPPSRSTVGLQGLPGTTVSGFGDTEFGIKYRFLQETASQPQVSFYPSVELPSGNKDDGIGNGRTWCRVPLWLQKSWGRWTTYGGGGYAFNSAPGMTNYPFAGWLIQRDLSSAISVGGELYYQGPQFQGEKSALFYNAGSYVALGKGFGILFSIGHTFSGEDQSVAYVALGWTGSLHNTSALRNGFTGPTQPNTTLR